MTDEEVQDYLERHTLMGASARFRREVLTLGDALKATPVARFVYRALIWTLDRMTALLLRLTPD